jgi:hypothetical protein
MGCESGGALKQAYDLIARANGKSPGRARPTRGSCHCLYRQTWLTQRLNPFKLRKKA